MRVRLWWLQQEKTIPSTLHHQVSVCPHLPTPLSLTTYWRGAGDTHTHTLAVVVTETEKEREGGSTEREKQESWLREKKQSSLTAGGEIKKFALQFITTNQPRNINKKH